MNESSYNFTPLGTHLIRVDGDSIHLITRGTLTLGDMRELLDHFARIKREHRRLFVLYDARKAIGVDPAARKLATTEHSEKADAMLQVIFGVSFALRVVLTMIVRAQKLLRNRDVGLHIFDTEAEARYFFDKEREKLRRQLASKSTA